MKPYHQDDYHKIGRSFIGFIIICYNISFYYFWKADL